MKKFNKAVKTLESNYTVTVSAMEMGLDTQEQVGSNNKPIPILAAASFKLKSDANKHIKLLMKQYGMKRHAGHIVNYSDQIELTTNY